MGGVKIALEAKKEKKIDIQIIEQALTSAFCDLRKIRYNLANQNRL